MQWEKVHFYDAIFIKERTEFLSKMKKHNVTRWQYPEYVHVPLSELGVVCKSLIHHSVIDRPVNSEIKKRFKF